MPRAVSTDITIAPAVDRERMLAAVLKLREIASETTERLLALLDDLDGDPDLEPSTNAYNDRGVASGDLDECEDSGDDEPSLGAAENHPNPLSWGPTPGAQLDWASGNREDREGDEHDGGEPDESGYGDLDAMSLEERGEDEHDGSEPDVDEELTLGRSESIDQSQGDNGSDDGEASLGWTDATCQGAPHWRGDSALPWSVMDGEAGDDNGYGDLDGMHDELRGEASLGWTLDCSLGKSGATWTGGAHDLEDDGDDREPEEDREPEQYYVDGRDPIDQRKLASVP